MIQRSFCYLYVPKMQLSLFYYQLFQKKSLELVAITEVENWDQIIDISYMDQISCFPVKNHE